MPFFSYIFDFIKVALLGVMLSLPSSSIDAHHTPKHIDINQYDSAIYRTAVIWHGNLSTKDFAVMMKAHCMAESGMRAGVSRNEEGYFSGRYAETVKKTAYALQRYAMDEYGSQQSIYTWRIDLSKSYGLVQIMGQRAYELGWRGYSFFDPEHGLLNVDMGLYYGGKLVNMNLKRYNYNIEKAISAYNAGSYTERNRGYINKITKYMKQFEHDFDTYK